MDPLDFELKALQAGAYDYICKPFRTRELKLKIDNQLKTFPFNYINDSNNINVSKSNLTNKIDTILEERFGDSSLSILFLCDSLNISQSTLNRKFFAETGFTVVNYIRFFRLNKAQKLLEVGELNKSLVAFACGFNSLSYFCKEYKLLFNSNPIRLNNKTTSLQA
jgi:transcriptional regulator GlxA family with amidase domain